MFHCLLLLLQHTAQHTKRFPFQPILPLGDEIVNHTFSVGLVNKVQLQPLNSLSAEFRSVMLLCSAQQSEHPDA